MTEQIIIEVQHQASASLQYAKVVTALLNESIVQVQCGQYYFAALSDAGVLYTFGRDNSYGELGRGPFMQRKSSKQTFCTTWQKPMPIDCTEK